MSRKTFSLVMLLSLTLVFVGMSYAGPKPKSKGKPFIKAKTFVYDPDNSGIVVARWVTHEGLPDAGKSDHALLLRKNGETAVVAAAGAAIKGVNGTTLSELGFDVRDDGHCGAGAPRFNVITTEGDLFFFGCSYGTHTPIGDTGWTRVRFGDADAFAQVSGDVWPGFGNVTVASITLIFDEGTDVGPGFAYVDNIDVNGTLIGKPGNAKMKKVK